jgi:hypothetical protein
MILHVVLPAVAGGVVASVLARLVLNRLFYKRWGF